MLLTFCLIFDRYEVQTVGDVLDHLDDGLQHVIQAGIDRANQSARVTAHMICDWRIMPNQFTYEVKKNQLYLTTKVTHPKQNLCFGQISGIHLGDNLFLVNKRCVIDSLLQGGELGLTGKMKRSAILEKHAACIASMFVHKSKHTYNSMCEASTAAIQDVKNHAPHQLLTQVIDLSILCRFFGLQLSSSKIMIFSLF